MVTPTVIPSSLPRMKRNWLKLRDSMLRRKKAPRTEIKRVSRLLVFTLVFVIDDRIINTNSRLRSYAKTKLSVSRVLPSRIWYRTTNWQRPSLMWDGASWYDNSHTKHSGMGEPLSRSTSSTRPLSVVSLVVMFSTRFPLISVSGHAPNVVSSMTVISMLQRTFWPQGLRWLPVERLSDQER